MERKEEVTDLLREFSDVFTDVPKITTLGSHSIQLTSSEPIRSKAYPLPFALREAVDKEIDLMLARGSLSHPQLHLLHQLWSLRNRTVPIGSVLTFVS